MRIRNPLAVEDHLLVSGQPGGVVNRAQSRLDRQAKPLADRICAADVSRWPRWATCHQASGPAIKSGKVRSFTSTDTQPQVARHAALEGHPPPAVGISDELHPRIQEQMRRHVDQTTGLLGRKVARINIDSWDDIDAKNAFINGVDRWSKRAIQENDPGNMPAFMTKEMGKTVMQFRSFMLASYSKQLLSGIHHRDWETFSAFATSMFLGALFYAGQTVVNAQGRGDKEEYLEKRLSPESLAKAAFQRAGFSSLLPLGVDTIAGVSGFGPVFDFRSTDLASGAWGNPTWDLIQGVQRGVQGVVAPITKDDYEFSQQDYRAITSTLLFQNAFVIRNALAGLGAELPKYSQ